VTHRRVRLDRFKYAETLILLLVQLLIDQYEIEITGLQCANRVRLAMSSHNLDIEMLVQQSAERRMIRVALTDIENSPGHQILLDTITAGDTAQPRGHHGRQTEPKEAGG